MRWCTTRLGEQRITARGQTALECSESEAWLAHSIRGHAVDSSHLVDHGMSETVTEFGQNLSYSSYGW